MSDVDYHDDRLGHRLRRPLPGRRLAVLPSHRLPRHEVRLPPMVSRWVCSVIQARGTVPACTAMRRRSSLAPAAASVAASVGKPVEMAPATWSRIALVGAAEIDGERRLGEGGRPVGMDGVYVQRDIRIRRPQLAAAALRLLDGERKLLNIRLDEQPRQPVAGQTLKRLRNGHRARPARGPCLPIRDRGQRGPGR